MTTRRKKRRTRRRKSRVGKRRRKTKRKRLVKKMRRKSKKGGNRRRKQKGGFCTIACREGGKAYKTNENCKKCSKGYWLNLIKKTNDIFSLGIHYKKPGKNLQKYYKKYIGKKHDMLGIYNKQLARLIINEIVKKIMQKPSREQNEAINEAYSKVPESEVLKEKAPINSITRGQKKYQITIQQKLFAKNMGWDTARAKGCYGYVGFEDLCSYPNTNPCKNKCEGLKVELVSPILLMQKNFESYSSSTRNDQPARHILLRDIHETLLVLTKLNAKPDNDDYYYKCAIADWIIEEKPEILISLYNEIISTKDAVDDNFNEKVDIDNQENNTYKLTETYVKIKIELLKKQYNDINSLQKDNEVTVEAIDINKIKQSFERLENKEKYIKDNQKYTG